MTSHFHQLAQNIALDSSISSSELKQYILFVIEQILAMKKCYEQALQSHLQSWVEVAFSAVRSAIYSKQSNQIGPKLELIYTSAINQQQPVNQRIDNIATLLLNENYPFETVALIKQKPAGLKYTETSQPSKVQGRAAEISQKDSFYINREKTISKGRSFSNGSQRRKLSKTSCFAQAKKISHMPHSDFAQTHANAQGFYKNSSGTKIKKAKKKEQNNFVFLQKCMSSTSPSSFMVNYMATTTDPQNLSRQQPTRRLSADKKEQKLMKQSVLMTQNQNLQQKQQLSLPLNAFQQNLVHQRNEAGTYEKMMVSFQEKIGQKLDQLMNKYAKIEEKLQSSDKYQLPKSQIKQQLQYSVAVHSPPPPKQTESLKVKFADTKTSSYPTPSVEQKASFVERQKNESKQKQNREKELSKKKPSISPLNKSISTKNKIVRNHVQDPCLLQDSIDSIILPKTSLKSLNLCQPKSKQPSLPTLDKIQKLQSKVVSKPKPEEKTQILQQSASVENDHVYIRKQILEFSKTTAKVILPISKKLLFILRKKYLTFCSKHRLAQSPQIKGLEAQEMQNEALELKDCLQKMEKILLLKCNQQKKQKLLLYVCSFLDSLLSFSQDNTILQLSNEVMSQQAAKTKIKQALTKLQ